MSKKPNLIVEAINARISTLEEEYFNMLSRKNADCLLLRERIQGLREAIFFVENIKEG